MRAVLVLAILIASVVPGALAGAATSEVDEARRRANEVAAELARSQSELAELEGEVADIERRHTAAESEVDELQEVVGEMAVLEFMRGADTLDPMLLDLEVADLARGTVLARFAVADTDDAVEGLLDATAELERESEALSAARGGTAEAVADVRERSEQATAELVRQERIEAERIEAERLANEERERRKAEEQARLAREEVERRADEESQRQAREQGAAPAPDPARVPAPPRAASVPAPTSAGGDWTCPVQGARAFTNDWGQPRSGGRRHQGTDILSPRGTPVVANVSGTVRGHDSSLGGVSYYLTGDDGNTYFGTHLESLSGASGRVTQGTVLGYVGNSGNARGGPTHLHFEIKPGGGAGVNPYPTLADRC